MSRPDHIRQRRCVHVTGWPAQSWKDPQGASQRHLVGNQSLFSVYLHKRVDYQVPPDSIFMGTEADNPVDVQVPRTLTCLPRATVLARSLCTPHTSGSYHEVFAQIVVANTVLLRTRGCCAGRRLVCSVLIQPTDGGVPG